MSVGFEHDGSVGTITLDNPPANSYDVTVMTEFSQAVDDALASDVRAVACDIRRKLIAGVPAGRMAEPYEIAEVVAFLASPEASCFTGQTLVVCGGRSFV